jgi:hypothetical protein
MNGIMAECVWTGAATLGARSRIKFVMTGVIPRAAGLDKSPAMLTGAEWLTDDRLLHQGLKINTCSATWGISGSPEWRKFETVRIKLRQGANGR